MELTEPVVRAGIGGFQRHGPFQSGAGLGPGLSILDFEHAEEPEAGRETVVRPRGLPQFFNRLRGPPGKPERRTAHGPRFHQPRIDCQRPAERVNGGEIVLALELALAERKRDGGHLRVRGRKLLKNGYGLAAPVLGCKLLRLRETRLVRIGLPQQQQRKPDHMGGSLTAPSARRCDPA